MLNRLAYGPSPVDLEEVEQLGAAAWIDRQLHPELISNEVTATQLKSFPTLTLSTVELLAAYPPPDATAQAARAAADARESHSKPAEPPPVDLPRQVLVELTGAKLVRAVESRHQLEEVLVDFWFNHFNVSADKGEVKWLVTSYERDGIRPHVFGNFRDLLSATAHHPAMLFYLDNWQSTKEQLDARTGRRRPGTAGLNENYGRELLELHTLGVDGGYTQADVREVARCFTGWSIDKPKKAAKFIFKDAMHDKGRKAVLGTIIPAGGGITDGERVIDLLVRHPSTARFVASKLARQFVSDHPSPALIERVASVFQRTRGNLRSVYAAIFSSPEFWSSENFQSKTKTPLEYVASAVRILGGTTNGDMSVANQLARMGMPPYRCQPPTGYSEAAEAWINPGALVNRINFALALTSNHLRGVSVDVTRYVRRSAKPLTLDDVVEPLARVILLAPPQERTRQTLSTALAEAEAERVHDGEHRPANPMIVAGLLLGSPEFQRH